MKAEKINLCGQDYYLLFNAAAMFEIDELRGAESIVELTRSNDKASIEILFKTVSILSEQGELMRRRLKYDKGTFLSADDLNSIVTPADVPTLKLAAYTAMNRGYGQEIKDDDQEIDLVLQEIEKKTGNG